METRNQGLQNSLRCLQHPLSLAGIALLLLNDHLLKSLSPSWLTGKLSDFAGLFFFPFIVATTLSFGFGRFKFSTRLIGQVSFGSVALWFVMLKTLPLANSITAQIASAVTGFSAHFTLDPSDTLALLVMFPAWKLWTWQREAKPTRVAYLILAIGGLAAIATSSIEWAVTDVTDLAYSDDGILYAADRATFSYDKYPLAKSVDGGLTWEREFSRDSMLEINSKIYPVQVCSKSNRCYRVTVTHELEILAVDQTWRKVFPSDNISVKANDIVIIAWQEKEYLVVAIGKGGILRQELPDGNWEIIGVINARGWY